jgi:Uma2 family endonuclease
VCGCQASLGEPAVRLRDRGCRLIDEAEATHDLAARPGGWLRALGYDFRMAPVTAAAQRPAGVHRLSVEDVHRMVAAGVLDEDDRVELVQGVLVDMVPIGAEHDGAVEWLTEYFTSVAERSWRVRVQSTLLISGGYLLPDLIAVDRLPRSQQPATALLVVEVAQTSQARDRDKARDYAAADVPEYWIVDLAAREVTVHRRPLAGVYDEVVTYADGESVQPLLAGAPAVTVAELMG